MAKKMSDQARYQARHAKQGLCRACSRPATRGILCDYHRERRRKEYQGRRKALRIYTCSTCGENGHNARVCKKGVK
jgi:hypothetical protein